MRALVPIKPVIPPVSLIRYIHVKVTKISITTYFKILTPPNNLNIKNKTSHTHILTHHIYTYSLITKIYLISYLNSKVVNSTTNIAPIKHTHTHINYTIYHYHHYQKKKTQTSIPHHLKYIKLNLSRLKGSFCPIKILPYLHHKPTTSLKQHYKTAMNTLTHSCRPTINWQGILLR